MRTTKRVACGVAALASSSRGIAVLLISLSVACTGKGCGAAKPAGNADAGALPQAQAAAAPGAVAAQPGNEGPGLRRLPAEALQLPVPRAFDLSHVEPAHFAVALGKDPSRIFEYVRDNIAFEPYVGVLRGPRGTLLAMAGNSADRASLLASMLASSGQRVRYARGSLPEPLAQELVTSIWAERPWVQPTSSGNRSPELKAAAEKLIAGITRDSTLLRDSLKSAGLPAAAGSSVTMKSLLKETRDHYWVEWWKDGAWVVMDPSFATSVPGQAYAKSEEAFDALPEALFHRVEVRIRLEEYTGDKPSSREVLRYSANAAEVSGVDLIVGHEPVDPKNQGTGQFTPFLIAQQKRVDGSLFWLKAPRATPAAGMLDAFGGGSGEGDVVPVASAESIEMDFIAPGGRKETVMREIFDRVGKKRRLRGETLSAERIAAVSDAASADDVSAAVYDVLITTGAIDAVHVTTLSTPPPPDNEGLIDVGAGLRRINIAFSAASDALTSRIAGANGQVFRSYPDTPQVRIAEFSAQAGVARLSLDLRRDCTRTAVMGLRPEHSFFAQVLRGVINGTLERFVIDHSTQFSDGHAWPGAPVVSTSLLFERAHAENTPAVFLTRDSSALGPELPEDARARIDEALASGHVLVTPRRSIEVAGAPRFAWWQIDSRSGLTTAVTDEGLHQATAEGMIVRIVERGRETVRVAFRVGGRWLPRGAGNFGSVAEAQAFCEAMTSQLAAQGIRFTWFALL